jgi:hypothetical protein
VALYQIRVALQYSRVRVGPALAQEHLRCVVPLSPTNTHTCVGTPFQDLKGGNCVFLAGVAVQLLHD